jgi:hypothetical protein
MPNITRLELDGEWITDIHVQPIRGMTQLRHLELSNSPSVSDIALDALAPLTD